MIRPRVMPCLLLRDGALVKTVRFKNPSYIGDPVNAIRIYNEKEVDELVLLDITATIEGRKPPFKLIEEIASECFMPVAYGGGVQTIEDIQTILSLGIEKVAINSHAFSNERFLQEACDRFGSSTIIASMDVHQSFFGKYKVYSHGGRTNTGFDAVTWSKRVSELGVGEILLNAIHRDGTQQGYDISLIKAVCSAVTVPVIACGGAGSIEDFRSAINDGGASAVAAGSMVVYYGPNRAVLINFPEPDELDRVLLAS